MLNRDQFLPGMEDMRPAKPFEQTESQFQKRPDVMVHGRYVDKVERGDAMPQFSRMEFPEPVLGDGFHAGTEKAAHERLQHLGKPWMDREARFFHGRVDPDKMSNTPTPGRWEPADAEPSPTDPGRRKDRGELWAIEDHDQYYRNDYEDEGSTSAILSVRNAPARTHATRGTPVEEGYKTPNNFETWRTSVGNAMAQGDKVPRHVQALYEASGGADGPHHNLDTRFNRPVVKARTEDEPIPGTTTMLRY